ncbi:MAG: hypothetical protein EOO92_12990 [Pedobacter sp.]|nr:MAG: hypothetical protein EOO92_12990 [Pedobacter sp.]
MSPYTRNIILIVLILLGSVPALFAQQEFQLRGAVLEMGTNTRIGSAQVQNRRTKFTSTSDNMGLFEIKAAVGDTLVVFRLEYSDATLVVPSPKDQIIQLRRSTTLKEVNIYGQSKKEELNDIKQEFKNKGSFYQGKPPALSFFFKPLTALYETFGRTPKNARRFGRYYENEMQQTLIDGFFNETIIKENTDLRDKELEDFMLYFRPAYEQAQNWTRYDAIKYIKDSYKGYKESLKTEGKGNN